MIYTRGGQVEFFFQARSLRISKMKLYRPKLNVLKPFYCISNQKNPPLLPTQPAQLCWATKLGKGGGFRWLELQSYNFEGSSFGYRCFIFEILSKIGDMLPTLTAAIVLQFACHQNDWKAIWANGVRCIGLSIKLIKQMLFPSNHTECSLTYWKHQI